MEKETILKKIKPFLMNNTEITEENFELVFSDLPQKEKYNICEVLEAENIEILYEEECEEEVLVSKNSFEMIVYNFDENSILDKVIPLLTNKDEILEADFEEIFQNLSQKEKYEILNILEKNDISLIFEKNIDKEIEETINYDFIFQKISPFITKNNWILESKFYEIFSFLSSNEVEKINDYLICRGIRLVDEKDEEYTKIIYVEDTKDYSDLSIEMLCGLYQKGNKSVIKDIYKKIDKLIYSRAMHYIKYFNNTLNFEDIYQYGYFGLQKAIERYQSSYDTNFSTYAVLWIDQSIRRNIMDNGFMIRLPVHIFNDISVILKLAKELNVENLSDVLKYIDFSNTDYDYKKINKSIDIISNFLSLQSLNIKVGNEDVHELLDVICGDNKWNPEELAENVMLKEEILEILQELKPNYKEILCYRFGLCNYPEKTLEEIGKMFKVTRERIRQIEKKALDKFKKNSKTKKLKLYLGGA